MKSAELLERHARSARIGYSFSGVWTHPPSALLMFVLLFLAEHVELDVRQCGLGSQATLHDDDS